MTEIKSVDNKPKQNLRYSEQEFSLMKSTFFEREDRLSLLRMFLFQVEMSEDEKLELYKFANETPAVYDLIKKVVHPSLDIRNAPAFQLTDLWFNVEIKDKDVDSAWGFIVAREKIVSYFDSMFVNLRREPALWDFAIKFSELTDIDTMGIPDQEFAKIHARNTIINHIEFQLNQVRILSLRDIKTPEEIKENAKKDSTQ